MTFFVLYDFYMICQNSKNPDRTTWTRWVSAILSTLCLARFAVPTQIGDGSSALAVVEWTNVALICHWTVNYPFSMPLTSVLRWGGVAGDVESRPHPLFLYPLIFDVFFCTGEASILSYVNSHTMMKWVNSLFIFVLGGCYIAGVWKGTLPTDRVPYISDMWVYPPGNWFSRWGEFGYILHLASFDFDSIRSGPGFPLVLLAARIPLLLQRDCREDLHCLQQGSPDHW